MPPTILSPVPPPWTLTGDVYFFSFWTSKAQARALPAHAFSPLEGASASADSTTPVGGLSMIQIIRYNTSPVGPYDELIVLPGSFEYAREDEQGRRVRKKNTRISRIYVSQKETCYHGRVNWNVPKHLARFDWGTTPDGATTVKVYPHDTHPDTSEAQPATTPFFQTTFKPLRFVPSFPFNTSWANKFPGVDTTLVLPPLPEGPGDVLPGTERWCSVVPTQYSRRSMLGWFDIAHKDDAGRRLGEFDNFWPGMGRWQMGVKMEDAEIVFGVPEEWQGPKSNL